MKTLKLGTLSMAVLLYAAAALAQGGHGGATGGGMGHEMASSNHGRINGLSLGSAHGKTADQILSKNTQLASKISKLTGQPATQACSGFNNLGQCVAAAHVSKNLGISFACAKSDMTGIAPTQGTTCPAGTGTKSMSLGKTIQSLDPKANQKAESRKGETQAASDLKGSNS